MQVGELKVQIDERFNQVDERFNQVDERFKQVDKQFIELRQQIVAEGEKTRRHFDVVAEQMKAERNLALDHAAFQVRLQDHEKRLAKLEE
jgi:hypothetical protein